MARGKYQHDTPFDTLLTLLCADRDTANYDRRIRGIRPYYERTVRGVADVLGISKETLFRYQTGITTPPRIIYEDIEALLNMGFFYREFWDNVAEFRVQLVLREMDHSGRRELLYEITFNTIMFRIEKIDVFDNRKFRDILLTRAALYTPPIDKQDWETIVAEAMSVDGYRGCDPYDPDMLIEECLRRDDE